MFRQLFWTLFLQPQRKLIYFSTCLSRLSHIQSFHLWILLCSQWGQSIHKFHYMEHIIFWTKNFKDRIQNLIYQTKHLWFLDSQQSLNQWLWDWENNVLNRERSWFGHGNQPFLINNKIFYLCDRIIVALFVLFKLFVLWRLMNDVTRFFSEMWGDWYKVLDVEMGLWWGLHLVILFEGFEGSLKKVSLDINQIFICLLLLFK